MHPEFLLISGNVHQQASRSICDGDPVEMLYTVLVASLTICVKTGTCHSGPLFARAPRSHCDNRRAEEAE